HLLRLGHALEHVGRLADHDRVDVLMLQSGVGERAIDRLAHEPHDADVGAARAVLRLSDADDGDGPAHDHLRSVPSTQTTFCCRQCPCAACAMARLAPDTVRSPAVPDSWRKTSPRRTSPVLMTGSAQSAPPDGFTAGLGFFGSMPSASS